MASSVEATPLDSSTCINKLVKFEDLEFTWGKKRGTGGKRKEVQFYESFTYDGVEYVLYDCVYMHTESGVEPYVGKLIKIWGNGEKSKKVKVQWFFRPSEIMYHLKDEKFMENEIFLASGEGIGLSNVNPLEAIAGKCNVLCISTDSRNRKPSEDDLKNADFVFYRVFDVGRCTLDMIGNEVGGLEVKFVFNRNESEMASDVVKLPSDQKEDKCANVMVNRLKSSSDLKIGTGDGNSSGIVLKKNGREVTHGDQNVLSSELGSLTKTKSIAVEPIEDNKVTTKALKDPCGLGKDVKSAKDLVDRPSKKAKIDISAKISEDKNKSNVQKPNAWNGENEDKVLPKAVNSSASKSSARLDNDSNSKISGADDRKSLVKSAPPAAVTTQTKAGHVKHSHEMGKGDKSEKESIVVEERISKKAKFDIFGKVSEDGKSNVQKRSIKHGEHATKASLNATNSFKERAIALKSSLGLDEGLSKAKSSGKPNKLSNSNAMSLGDASTNENQEFEGKSFEATPRHVVESVSWFKEPSWEERMQTANDEGSLVLLQNLDPGFTSAEVQDIIWHALKEKCSAKMFQRTASSSSNSGQALAIFRTREVAERVIKRLKNRCLMVSNERPLVADIVALPKSQRSSASSFVGHIFIERVRHQMQREMREAVSTSHCSQPNTIEYEMAMEWRLLQSRSDFWWRRLYKQQNGDWRRIATKLKSK
ncbi:PREDICTED: protein ANTI-SILENCING 1 isoform X3 [Ipomoea nil]|nr:PREDICTED: protein ANTI-SILENCING 1 isoform X3 [Ipomoea nil]